MLLTEVLAVVTALETAGPRYWIAGGWGVDALVGRQTRAHRDLDMAIDAAEEPLVLAALGDLGYRVETDQRPARVELAARGRGWVDLHPVTFDTAGSGRQADLADGFFHYPPGAFGSGSLDGRPVRCLSAAQQLEFRRGYPWRDVDVHDVGLLRDLAG